MLIIGVSGEQPVMPGPYQTTCNCGKCPKHRYYAFAPFHPCLTDGHPMYWILSQDRGLYTPIQHYRNLGPLSIQIQTRP